MQPANIIDKTGHYALTSLQYDDLEGHGESNHYTTLIVPFILTIKLNNIALWNWINSWC